MSMLEFYCCDCQRIFESEPDGTGYEQAPCPQCELVCMTAAFEGQATGNAESKLRFVIVAEFADEKSAEPLTQRLEEVGIPVQINLPDVTQGDFFLGGNDNVCVLVPADLANQAREIING